MVRRKEKPWISYVNAPANKEYALATFKYNYNARIGAHGNKLINYLREGVVAKEQELNDIYDDDDYEDGWARNEALHELAEKAVLRLAAPLFEQKAPPVKTLPKGLSVQDLVWYPKVYFRLQTIDSTAKIFEITPDQAVCAPEREILPGPDASFTPDPRFPMHSAGDIQVLKIFDSGNGPACQVRLVDGQVVMSKTPPNGLKSDDIKREMRMVVAIHDAEARLGISVATPHLLGYVTHAEDPDLVIGFLREWVPSSSRLGATLECVPLAKTDVDTRQKWADQIKETMDDLHDMGLFWGDCKAANVIVDEEENTWLIDLGGQFTQNWVDKEIAGTLAGDEQGYVSILKFLGLVECDMTELRRLRRYG